MLHARSDDPSPYVDVHQAATVLGVDADTVRIWAQNSVLPGAKISNDGQWIFSHSTVMETAGRLGGLPSAPDLPLFAGLLENSPSYTLSVAGQLTKPTLPSHPHDRPAEPHADHYVQFYETDAVLIDSLEHYVSTSLDNDDTCMVVATRPHLEALEGQLIAHGADTAAARKQGQLIMYDAAGLRMRISRNGTLEWSRFYRIVGARVAAAAARQRPVNIFGEVVSLLMADGETANVVKLEKFWNTLAGITPFTLFCAYPIHSFSRKEHSYTHGKLHDPLNDILASHARTKPAESHSRLDSEEARARNIIRLQQKASILQHHTPVPASRKRQNSRQDSPDNLNAARDNFIKLAAHNLRTPPTIIKQYAEILLHGFTDNKLSSQQKQYLNIIIASNDREIALINELLLVARLDAGTIVMAPELFDAAQLIRRVIATDTSAGKYKVDLRIDLPDSLPLKADPYYLSLVISQLVSNACKYSADSRQPVTICGSRPAGMVSISVTDKGVGIAPARQSELYQKFSDLQDQRFEPSGIGLGLYWSKKIIELHGGSFELVSEHGHGTTVTLILPSTTEVR